MRKSCQQEHGAMFGSISSSITVEMSQDCAEGRTSSFMSLLLSTPSGKRKSCCVPVLGHSSAQQAPGKSSTTGTGVTSHSQMATSSQEFVCITGRGRRSERKT